MIVLSNIDSVTWSLEYKTIEIIKEMLKNDSIVINLNAEGPCARSLGLYNLLDDLCEKFNYDKSNIIIHTHNQLEKHSSYKIKKFPPLYIPETQSFIINNQSLFKEKSFDKNFKKFGLFIGRSNEFRLKLASVLYDQYLEETALTFHYDRDIDFHRNHLGFEEILKKPHSFKDIDRMIKLIKSSPIKSDDLELSYPILSPSHLNISKIYHSFFVEIVCETYFSGDSFYPTEKIWRPIILKTPFIIQGPRNFYQNLKKLGFKTFHDFWNEGFSEDPHDYQPDCIIKIINELGTKTLEQLKTMHDDMTPILEHNFDVFMRLHPNDFKSVFEH